MSWDPDVEQRPHPFGEAGVRSSLEEVCKRAAEGASELLGNPKHLARVRTWAIDRLHRAKQRGEAVDQPGDRARVLLKAVQDEKLWVPDPIGIEYIPKAHLMACDGDTHDDGTPCVKGDDCFAQGTLVLTDEQVGKAFLAIPVERLQAGMKIWGLERWSVVEAVWSKGDLDVDEIEFDNGSKVCLTPDHHVYVIQDGDEKRITVAELRPGDVVPRPAQAIVPGAETGGVAHREVRSITRNIGKEPCWDITTDDHRVYLPEHDVTVSQCDGKIVFLAACFMSVGLYTMIVGHSYERNGTIGHVLTKVYYNNKWHYADASPTGNGKYLPLGKSAPFTRERYYSMPTIKVVCDAASCDVRNFDPQELGFVEKGMFVGLNGIAVMEMPPVVEWLGGVKAPVVEWLGEARASVEWLGAGETLIAKYSTKLGYMGLNKATDAITSNILASGGSTPFQSYAATAGAAGGSAICAPYGPAASSLCGAVGGTIAKILAGGLFKSPEEEWQTPGIWNSDVKWIRIGQEGVAAIRGYLTQRDFYLDWVAGDLKGAQRDDALAWANDWLIKNGLPAAPIHPHWAPRKDFWDTYKEVESWSHQPGVWPPFSKTSGKYAAGQPTSSYYKESNGVGGWCQLANQLKQSCSSIILASLYLGGPPAAPDTAIDWGVVGAFQIASVPQISGRAIVTVPNTSSPVGETAFVHKNALSQHKKSYGEHIIVADVIPAQIGGALSLLLQEKGPLLIEEAKKTSSLKPTPPQGGECISKCAQQENATVRVLCFTACKPQSSSGSGSSSSSGLKVVLGGAALAAAIWAGIAFL